MSEKWPWDRTRIKKDKKGNVVLTARQYEQLRAKVQLLETILDGATQQKKPNRRRLKLALSTIRSIQALYFPQLNYSLHYFKGGNKAGEQALDRQNYRKYKRLKDLEKIKKFGVCDKQ